MKKLKYFIPCSLLIGFTTFLIGVSIFRYTCSDEVIAQVKMQTYYTYSSPHQGEVRPTLCYQYKGVTYDNVNVIMLPGNVTNGSLVSVRVLRANPRLCYTMKAITLFPTAFSIVTILAVGFSILMVSDKNKKVEASTDSDDDDFYYDYNEPESIYNSPVNYGAVDDYLFYHEEPQVNTKPDSAANAATEQEQIIPDTPKEPVEEKEPFSYEPPETVLGTYDKIYNNPSPEPEQTVDPLKNYNPNDYGTDLEELQDAYNKYFNYNEDSVEDDKYDYFFKKR
jgi:hypothetical protein